MKNLSEKAIQDRKKDAEYLRNQIHSMDQKHLQGIRIDLQERNNLVALLKKVESQLPIEFSPGEKVYIKGKRKIEGRVVEILKNRQILVKPIDNLYKDVFSTSELLLEKYT